MATYIGPEFNIHFTVVEPGGIRTQFVSNIMTQVSATGGIHNDEYKPMLDAYFANAAARRNSTDGGGIYQTSAECAAPIVACVQMADPPIRLRTSAWAEEFCRLKVSADPDGKLLRAIISQQVKPPAPVPPPAPAADSSA